MTRILLWPFSLLYGFAVWIRNILYDFGILKSQRGSIPSIILGNLAVGGTGKTPHTDFVVQILSRGNKTAILSRGYGRKTKGFVKAGVASTASEIGDEPLLLHLRNPTIPLAVCEDRLEGIRKLKSEFPECNLVVLDDAFQHRRLAGDVTILLSEFNNLWINDLYLPAGKLRDARNQYRRAQIILITKCPDNLTVEKMHSVEKELGIFPNQKVWFTAINYGQPIHFHGPSTPFSEIPAWVVPAGIANPQPFFQHIENQFSVKKFAPFSDHHIFSQSELEMLSSECGTFGNRSAGWLTTEKDAMRLKEMRLPEDIPMYFIPISISFIRGQEDFQETIEKLLSGVK